MTNAARGFFVVPHNVGTTDPHVKVAKVSIDNYSQDSRAGRAVGALARVRHSAPRVTGARDVAMSVTYRRRVCWKGAAAGILMAGSAMAETVNISGTHVTIQPTERPGAIAEVVMRNEQTNGPQDHRQDYTLTLDGMTVGIRFAWQYEGRKDAVFVAPPDGVICDPSDCILVVDEDTEGTLYLLEWMGM